MNRGTTRHSEHYCDKCGSKITRVRKHTYYKYNSKACAATKDFDLCTSCNKELRDWIKSKNSITIQQLINSFPIFLE